MKFHALNPLLTRKASLRDSWLLALPARFFTTLTLMMTLSDQLWKQVIYLISPKITSMSTPQFTSVSMSTLRRELNQRQRRKKTSKLTLRWRLLLTKNSTNVSQRANSNKQLESHLKLVAVTRYRKLLRNLKTLKTCWVTLLLWPSRPSSRKISGQKFCV